MVSDTATPPSGAEFNDAARLLPPHRIHPDSSSASHVARDEDESRRRLRTPRAERACLTCRSRKVRCNVVVCNPCVNCRMDGLQCVVPAKKNRKRPRAGSEAPVHGSIKCQRSNDHHNSECQPPPPVNCHTRSSLEGTENPKSTIIARMLHNIHWRELENCSRWPRDEVHSHYHHPEESSPTLPYNELHIESNMRRYLVPDVDCCRGEYKVGSIDFTDFKSLPSYIRPLPRRIAKQNMAYILQNGALTLPDRPLQQQLIRCYIDYVYPFMPSIDLREFLLIVCGNAGDKKHLNLLLYHSVLFAGAAFVDISLLEGAGYRTRMEAQWAFYNKARVLYDCDYELDDVTTIQSILLMTHWYERPESKDPWYWTGIALSFVYTAGIHRDYKTSRTPNDQRRLWRRIWWSCYMRDRIVTLGSGRPSRIKDEDYSVTMLTLEDFEIGPFPLDCLIMLPTCRFLRDTALQKDLALMCMEKAKLSTYISDVLSVHDQPIGGELFLGSRLDKEPTGRSFLPETWARVEKIRHCEEKLEDWIHSLPERFAYGSTARDSMAQLSSLFVVNRSALHLVYFAAVSSLYRLLVLPSNTKWMPQSSLSDRNSHQISYSKTRSASYEISRICSDMWELKLDRFLPSYSLVALLPAIMVHLITIRSSESTIPKEAIGGFRNCERVLKNFRHRSTAATYTDRFLRAAIDKAGRRTQAFIGKQSNGTSRPQDAGCGKYEVELAAHMPDPDMKHQMTAMLDEDGRHLFPVTHSSPTPPQDELVQHIISPESLVFHLDSESLTQVYDSVDCGDNQISHDVLDGVMNGECGSLFL